MKKLLFTFLAAMCCMAMNAQSALVITDTNGREYYAIETAAELVNFAQLVNEGNTSANAVLMADIKMNDEVLNDDGTLNGTPQNTWTPIGNSSHLYAGEFNGNGHTISGLYFNDQNQSKIGLFGMTTAGAHIHNLGIKDSYFNGKDHVGGICGDFMNGLIENCWSEVVVYVTTGDGGGLTGSVFTYAVLKDCYTICSVDGSGSRGLVCGAQTGTIENCYARQINSTGTTIAIGWTDSNAPTATNVEIKSQDAFASGEVCHLLNEGVTDGTHLFYQTLTKDNNPVLDITHMTVFKSSDGTFTNTHILGDVRFLKASDYKSLTDCMAVLQESSYIGMEESEGLYVNVSSVLIIPQEVSLDMGYEKFIDVMGAIYVFGQLSMNFLYFCNFTATVNIMNGGTFSDNSTYKCDYTLNNNVSPTVKKIPGRQPTVFQPGWKDYYIQGIETSYGFWQCNNDYYADAACTQKITDLETWKKGTGRIDALRVTFGNKTYAINDEGSISVSSLTFSDKDSYQSDYDFTVTGNLTYIRSFKATGVWQAWFVPFDVPVSDMNAAGMEVAEIAGVLMDENKQPYIAFAKMTDPSAIVKANTPYVVKTKKSSVSMTLTGPDMCIRKSTSTELEAKRLTVQSSYNTFTFGGNYQQTNGYANEWYALNTSGVFQKMGDGANLAPQRFWMTIDTRTDTPYYTDESGAATTEFINFTVWGDDEPTGIETIDNGQWTIDNSQLYDLQGQKVTSIQKGQVYIMNGKKFFAK